MSHSESADDYDDVVTTMANGKWRVVSCNNNIQWILQRNSGKRNGLPWVADSFCRTREALVRLTKQKTQATEAELDILSGLPDWHP